MLFFFVICSQIPMHRNKMKRFYILSFLLITFNLLSINLFSQKSEIGFQIGYGNTHFEESTSAKFLFGKEKDFGQFYTLGIHYYQSAKGDVLRFRTGLNHNRRIEDKKRLNNLQIPIGVDFNLGRKIRFVFGGGFYGNLLISYTGFSEYSDFEETKNRIQFGAYYNLGIGIQITQKYHVSLMARKNNDISAIYKDIFSHHGGHYTEYKKGFDGYIGLSLHYRLFTQNKTDEPI